MPADHPLRVIRTVVNAALGDLSGAFSQLYARLGRPSIPPEKLLRALLLQAFYSIRSERQLMERLRVFRPAGSAGSWALGSRIPYGTPRPSPTRERLLAGEVAARFLATVLARPEVKGLLPDDHFAVDGTLIQAWASMKSFRPKNGPAEPPPDGRNDSRDFHGERRRNRDARLDHRPRSPAVPQGSGQGFRLSFMGHC